MNDFPQTIVIRHKRENLKKCSLRGLEKRTDFCFYSYPLKKPLVLDGYLLLTLDCETELSETDQTKGIVLLDATWRLAEDMQRSSLFGEGFEKRRLPSSIQTAYPRRQTGCNEPDKGLASVEALFVAYCILKRKTEGLLDSYYWKEAFIEKNRIFC